MLTQILFSNPLIVKTPLDGWQLLAILHP